MAYSASIDQREKLSALSQRKGKQLISALTAYDYAVARILDEAGIDIILVGDSLGMMVFGHEDTTQVTMEMMVHHVKACRKGIHNALLVADLPYKSYETTESATTNAKLLVQAGADAVKLEGGKAVLKQTKAILHAGIAVIGHIGMLPQQVREEGGYKKKGKSSMEAQSLLSDAKELEASGITALVIESIVEGLGEEITSTIDIPTIGIGAGNDCDGQILVVNDLLGSYPWFCPGFAKPKVNLASQTSIAVKAFIEDLNKS
ncbi:MAG: 3-methyl-2-oxobutanoate hydroxymethyltransferase [Verrucomicrobiaceae bacterium]|nr:3-methyl-2-oxobutanoate hydroxymethyltransferase [Verrucomicrobiaceae bacterium]